LFYGVPVLIRTAAARAARREREQQRRQLVDGGQTERRRTARFQIAFWGVAALMVAWGIITLLNGDTPQHATVWFLLAIPCGGLAGIIAAGLVTFGDMLLDLLAALAGRPPAVEDLERDVDLSPTGFRPNPREPAQDDDRITPADGPGGADAITPTTEGKAP
jgi:hypothetical protein